MTELLADEKQHELAMSKEAALSLPTNPQPSDVEPVLNHGGRPKCFNSTIQEILFILTVTMGVAMSSFLQGSTIVILSFAGADLNMSTTQITWITASSALTSGSFLLFFGKVADMFGRRTMFIGSLFLYAVFALAAGFSKNAITLDVLNGMLGLMSASAVPPAQGILGSIYEKPSKRKNGAFACFSVGNPMGFVFGSIFSGIATQLFNWRAAFFLLAIIYLVFACIAFLTVPNDDSEKLPFTMESIRKFDFVGTALTISGIGLFSTGLSLGPDASEGWRTPYVIVFIILGVVLMAAFVWWECYFSDPLMPMGIWRDREFSLLISILLLGFMAFTPMSFYISLYMQEVWQYSPLNTAVHLLPMAISGFTVNVVAGLILHIVSNKLLMGIGAAAYPLACLLAAVQRTGDSYWAFTFPALVIVVIGADFQFNVANMYVLSSLPKSSQSTAGSIFQTATKLSVTIGLAATTAVFNSVSKRPATSGYYAHDPVEPYAAVWWFCTALSAVSILLVPFLKIKTQGHEA